MHKDPMKLVEKGYRKIAAAYHRRRLKSSGTLMLLNKLMKKLPKRGKVLDVGCGGGYPVSKFFADNGYSVIGIDLSSEMLKIARKTVPKGKFYKMNMVEMRFPRNCFDIVVSFFSIVHVPRKFHWKVIRDIYRVLKSGGKMLITMPIKGGDSWIEKNWHGAAMYWSGFDKQTNLKIIREAGFKIVWNKDIGPKGDRFIYILAKKLA